LTGEAIVRKKKKDIEVLLVDDEQDFVDTLAERLQARDLKVDVVYDGKQAMTFLKEKQPDVIVLDLKMPGLHGIEVLRLIKKSYKDVQVIILTGHGTDKDEMEARRLGGFDFLKKPADLDLLVSKINEAFWEKVERVMTAAAYAEEGLIDTATKIMEKEEDLKNVD
jgi:DNA-binding response OmpR family regulator